jgi:hypothetical protein
MLHITNGDSAADTIRETGIAGSVLPWRDVLHEGPVPGDLTLEALSELRARFLAGYGGGPAFEETLREFRQRDAALQGGLSEDEIVLWFEADLYDQLQIIQLLDWIGRHPRPMISIICIGAFPGINNFVGIGQLSAPQMAGLFPARLVVTQKQITLASEAWQAFTAPDPIRLNRLVSADTSALEFLGDALMRLLAEYPLWTTGLGETERQVLRALQSGPMSFDRLFPAVQGMEERPFMGDMTLWSRILEMKGGPQPTLKHDPPDLRLTEFGLSCLKGTADYLAFNGIDRWIGGVHLTSGSQWRWDPRARQVGQYPSLKE